MLKILDNKRLRVYNIIRLKREAQTVGNPHTGVFDGTSALRAQLRKRSVAYTLARIGEFFASARPTQSPLARGKKVISMPAYAGENDFFEKLREALYYERLKHT